MYRACLAMWEAMRFATDQRIRLEGRSLRNPSSRARNFELKSALWELELLDLAFAFSALHPELVGDSAYASSTRTRTS